MMAATTKRVVMPQLGESVHEGTISKWLVKPGDKVILSDMTQWDNADRVRIK